MINEVQSTVDPNQIKVIESQSMIPFALTIGIILAVLIILKFVIEAVRSRPKRTGIERTHSLKGLRESAIKKELEQSLVENASVKHRYKIETLCTQAGFNLSFGEYVLICFFCAIFFDSSLSAFRSGCHLIASFLYAFLISSSEADLSTPKTS